MAIEVSAKATVCKCCGKAYGNASNFYASHASLYRGTGRLHICKECVQSIYNKYLMECGDIKNTMRALCRKLDLYWDGKLFDQVERANAPANVLSAYLTKVNGVKFSNLSYDDTLRAENALFLNPRQSVDKLKEKLEEELVEREKLIAEREKSLSLSSEPEGLPKQSYVEINDDVRDFWGPGYDNTMYAELEQRRRFWLKNLPSGVDPTDMGVQALLRQICSCEIDINRERAAGRSTDKLVNTLNTLLGSAAMKPTQKKDDINDDLASVPLGVWIDRYEHKRPIPEVDEDLKDTNKVVKYILTWVFGHLCKLVGIRNSYSRLYEEEMERLRVERPDFADENDEDFLSDIFDGGGEDNVQV